jgi:predicted esterase YcpF (UPF0227 family)
MSDAHPALLIYLHGFNSSPSSFKARYLAEYLAHRGCEKQYLTPELDSCPATALAQVKQIIETHQSSTEITLIGSSLGGYYATSLAEQYGLRAVLINPAVYPYRLLNRYLGVNRNYHTGVEYEMKPEYMQQLLSMEAKQLREPQRYLVLLQTADETLDYRHAAEKYSDTQLVIKTGGSHGYDDFDKVVPQILQFAGFKCCPNP